MLFVDQARMHLDAFIDAFSRCHTLPLTSRLGESVTLPPADLLLTKLQVVQVNGKDILDVAALLHDWLLSQSDDGINVAYIAALLAKDWGWWRTVTENLRQFLARVPSLPLFEPAADRSGARPRLASSDRHDSEGYKVALPREAG